MKEKLIAMRIEERNKNLLKEAGQIIGLSLSSFSRSAAVKEATRILKQNKEGDS